MSKYTTQIRYICEFYAGLQESEGQMSVNDIIEKAIPKMFDFPWDIFDEDYRNVLAKKILKHFYTREIAFETVGLFKLKLDTKMNEIMPLYNQYYKSALIEFNPLYNVDYTTTDNRVSKGDKSSNGNSVTTVGATGEKNSQKNDNNNRSTDTTFNDTTTTTYGSQETTEHNTEKSIIYGKTEDSSSNKTQETNYSDTKTTKNKYSDTPQGALSNVETGTYLTNATINDENASGNGNVTDTEKSQTKQSGNDVETLNGNDVLSKEGEDANTHTGTNNVKDVFGGVETYGEKTKNDSSTNVDNVDNEVYSNIDDYISHVIGKNSGDSYSKLLNEFRDTFLNVDMMVIDSLEELFLQIW